MLHHVAKFEVLLANLVVGHGQDLLHILKSEAIALQTLKSLSTTDECLDIFRINFKNGSAIFDGPIKVANLLVARCSVGVGFHGELRHLLSLLLQILNAFGVLVDGALEVSNLILLIALLLVHFRSGKTGLALCLILLKLGLDLGHHPLNVGVARVEATCQLERLVRTSDVAVGHLFVGLAAVGSHLLPALEFGNVLLHLLEVGIRRLDCETTL
mmetsp:Transcript_11861/g.24500  ORF Transcript_11861/g.24500 Transcript_11861/m.24500 type:complete len:214 (-) Transcript_11861:394-1035(-)